MDKNLIEDESEKSTENSKKEEDCIKNSSSESNSSIVKPKPMRLNRTEKKRLRYERRLENYKTKKKEEKLKREITLEPSEELDESQDPKEPIEKKTKSEADHPHNRDGIINLSHKELKERKKERLRSVYLDSSNVLKICIDCSFSEFMSHKEMSRLAQQIGRCHASNKSLSSPVHLTLCNLNRDSKFYKELCRINDGFDKYVINKSDKSIQDYYKSNMQNIVYLSPDSETYLETIDVNKTYVIGGLVDETVTKKVTIDKCNDMQIKAYSLPIEKYMTRKAQSSESDTSRIFNFSKILAINQVFDIMASFFNHESWTEAFKCGVPKRKGFYIKEDKEQKQ